MTSAEPGMKDIAVFGGSAPRPGQSAYEEAYQLGVQLAQAGYRVLNGGYIGTMEAVSRGAFETGGQVVGFSCDEIERWRGVQINRWVCEERRYDTLRSRLMAMVDACDAALALTGGVGTLAEVSMMWNHLLTQAIPSKPLILIGPAWEAVYRQFIQSMESYILPEQRRYIHLAPDPVTTVRLLNEHFAGSELITDSRDKKV